LDQIFPYYASLDSKRISGRCIWSKNCSMLAFFISSTGGNGTRLFRYEHSNHAWAFKDSKDHIWVLEECTAGMVQAWVGQKLLNVTFNEFFLCPIW
jgi:hypothetical protein